MNHKKVILITGTSRGIGKATAEYLKAKGYIVYGSSRGAANMSINQLQLEVTDFESCKSAVGEVVKTEGRLDVLINNAAYELVGAHEEYTVEEIRDQVEVNFFGALHMMKAATTQMLKQKSGNIINISSIGSDFGWTFNGAYSAGKFAMHGYSEAIRRELLPLGINVSLISPAGVASGTTNISVQHSKHRHPLFEKASNAAFEASHSGGDLKMASSMETVAQTIEKVIEAKRPKFIYRIGFVPRLMQFMNTILSQRGFEKFYMKALKAPTKAPSNY
jgi:NAD(P)-dependent dehydrogenase (short-subunit alcohol dehydrogenase family)